MNRLLASISVAAFLLAIGLAAKAQLRAQGAVARTFTDTCAGCHGNPNVQNAPDLARLRQMTPESVYAALTDGAMRVQAQNLTDDTKRALTEYLTGRQPGIEKIADAAAMSNHCSVNDSLHLLGPMWNGYGLDAANTRFQQAPGAHLSADQVPQLKLKWAFGFPGATVVYSPPTVVGGRVFIGLDTGYVYSLDAATGCVYWSYQAQAGVRSAISVGALKGQGRARFAAYFGDIRGKVYALDAVRGKLLWTANADDSPVARITGAPKLYGNRLYVPVSSMEESVGGSTDYPCCRFRGSVVALDAYTGAQVWKTHTIAEPAKPTRKNSKGTQLWGPSGGGVWNSPVIDPKQHAVYVGTGDGYSLPATKTTDAVMALDMKTGKILWSVQDTPGDAWIILCAPPNVSENCPDPLGPDYDFGASLILKTLPSGRRILIAGQKSGTLWAHDPDRQGALVWKAPLVQRLPAYQGEIVWGGAADDRTAYFGLNSGGLAAVNLSDGHEKWFAPLRPAPGLEEHYGHSSPVAAIPGVIFSDGWDGVVRAIATEDGRVLWEFNTVRGFDTVNSVSAKGGSMGGPGPAIAGGMLFVGSGYVGIQNGIAGNVLLAFAH